MQWQCVEFCSVEEIMFASVILTPLVYKQQQQKTHQFKVILLLTKQSTEMDCVHNQAEKICL